MVNDSEYHVPADVPTAMRQTFVENYLIATHSTGRMVLLEADRAACHGQRPSAAGTTLAPEQVFRIANQAMIGVLAVPFGMLCHFGADYHETPYLVKLNLGCPDGAPGQDVSYSPHLVDVDQVAALHKQTGLHILGVGATVALGSGQEAQMVRDASQMVARAHQHGLIAVLWMSGSGGQGQANRLLQGAGLALVLGCDFAVIDCPEAMDDAASTVFREAVTAAGRCRLICSGGLFGGGEDYLQQLQGRVHNAGASGAVIPADVGASAVEEGVRQCNAVSAVALFGKDAATATAICRGERELE